MDATITYDEVVELVGVNIPSLEPHPNFKQIQTLHYHFEHELQCLPCPQSIKHVWKGMVMARELYALLATVTFRLPVNPGDAIINVYPTLVEEAVNTTPLMRTEQASIYLLFTCQKHYFMSMQNIKRACFTALDASINNAFMVSNIPTGQG
jgi:hypothetical protein